MKAKNLPYLLLCLVIVATILLVITGKNNRPHVLNERVSLRKRDKIPYGTYVAYENLKNIFPLASVTVTRQEPAYWDSLSVSSRDQALIIICPEFMADKYEMKNLVRFAETGNDVFISTMYLAHDVTEFLNCDVRTSLEILFFSPEDTLTVSLASPPFDSRTSFSYPGKQMDSYFSRVDTTITTVVGYDATGRPDFIHFKAGQGNLYVQLAPMAFTNYFLLHKNNFAYYEKAFSMISPDTKKIGWDEYYIYRKSERNKNKKSNWFSSFLRYPGLRAGLLTALLALLVYVLMEMRRKQRYIPVVKKPVNDSLDFVKTIGRLYHDKGDHLNLSRKMAAYFLEHVRNRYKLPTSQLNDDFTRALHVKTGVDETEINFIVSFIRELDMPTGVSDKQLAFFHKQLESFYKKA